MKIAIASLTALLAIATLLLALGVFTGGTEGLGYVISGSMVPTLDIGDGFLLVPPTNPEVGDVITYRPLVLPAKTVTHRIVKQEPSGFITKGDHNVDTDQSNGEPLVVPERIVGRVAAFGGNIIRIPYLGPASKWLRELLQKRLWVLAAILVGTALVLGLFDQGNSTRPARRRWRLGIVHRALTVGAVAGLLVTMVASVQVEQVEYLASMDPGDVANHVPVGKPGAVRLKVANGGLMPVYSFSEGIAPSVVVDSPAFMGPRSTGYLTLQTPPRAEPGWYRDYIRVYRYPPLLPHVFLAALHDQSPFLAMSGLAGMLAAVLWFLGRFLNLWMPLRAMQDRRTPRVLRRLFRIRPSRRRII